jgi:hypothetical protein
MGTWFICPKWIRINKISIYASLVIASVVLLSPLHYDPATSLARMIIPDWLFGSYQRLSIVGLAVLASIWIYSLFYNAWQVRKDKKWLFCYFLVLLIGLTPIAISYQFSSRYVVTDISGLVLILSPQLSVNFLGITRFALGILLGIATLLTYYHL